ncbi:MarR family winged helix-turn-helix transcriptional regulator [Blastococcus sp. SYSU D00820]
MATEPAEAAQLDHDLGWMLGALFRSYVRAAESTLRDLPGGPRGYQVLTAAIGEPPRNQGAIAEELGIDRTVLTYLIDDLERLDLVVRRPDPADRRSRLVVATDTGRAEWQQRRQALDHVETHLLGPLPPARAATFRTLLQELACAAQALDPLDDLCEAARHVLPAEEPPAAPPTASHRRRRG